MLCSLGSKSRQFHCAATEGREVVRDAQIRQYGRGIKLGNRKGKDENAPKRGQWKGKRNGAPTQRHLCVCDVTEILFILFVKINLL